MKNKSTIKLISRYIDGMLDENERHRVEELLQHSTEAQSVFNDLKMARTLLLNKPRIPESPFFWSRLSHRLEHEKEKSLEESFLPIPRKYLPALGLLGFIAIAVGVALIMKNTNRINQYVTSQVKTVKSFYESTLNTTFFPFLSDVTNDDVLTFAVGGYVPVKNSDEVIEFGNTGEKKYWVKLKKNSQTRSINIGEFSKAVDLKNEQLQRLNEVLAKYKPELEKSILLTHKDTMAIASHVWDMNNAIMFDIARTLNNAQRREFEQWVSVKNPESPLHLSNVNFENAERLFVTCQDFQKPSSFVFVTPETTFLHNATLYDRSASVPKNTELNVALQSFPQPMRHKTLVCRKTGEGNKINVRFESVQSPGPPNDAAVFVQISTPDVQLSIPDKDVYKAQENLYRELRRIRIPKMVYEVTQHAVNRSIEEASRIMNFSGERITKDNPPTDIIKAMNISPSVRARNRVYDPSQDGFDRFHFQFLIDSAFNVKMHEVEKRLQVHAVNYDSLARIYKREANRVWREAMKTITIDDTSITIVDPDTQKILIKKRETRK